SSRTANMVTRPRNPLVFQNEGSSSQAHSGSHWGFSFWYQAKPSSKAVSPIRYGRKGSTHEKVDAAPLIPATNAITGVIQHREAVKAAIIPAPIHLVSALLCCCLFMRPAPPGDCCR